MPDRPHVIVPSDVTLSLATSEGPTSDVVRLAALTHTARSRLVITTASPDASRYRQAPA